jgi:hypothetical protein
MALNVFCGEIMNTRVFVERLNQGLDDIGVPTLVSERVDVFAKLLDVPRFKAEAILNGRLPIDQHILEKIAKELEVSPEWLLGHDDHSG